MKAIIKKRNEKLYERYNLLNKQGENYDSIKRLLSSEFELGELYIMSILYSYGIKKLNNRKMSDRDAQIISLFLNEESLSSIEKKLGLTSVRIGQVVRKHLGDKPKMILLGKHLYKVKKDIEDGLTHQDIIEKYDKSLLSKLNRNFGFNPFEHYLEKRNKLIIQLFKEGNEALDIAKKFNLTRDYVYGICHEYGIRKRPTREEYNKRNKKILRKHNAGVSSKDLAKEFGLGVTNINIIIKNMKK